MPTWTPGERVGSYRIEQSLKSGGMGTLVLARKEGAAGFERRVAIKVVHAHLATDASFVRMFIDEAKIASRIHHPNVVHVEELAEVEGTYYLVMEYVPGCPVSQLLSSLSSRQLRLAPDVAIYIAAQAAEGLHAAHEARGEDGELLNVVHRDVSPQNVLLSTQGTVKVIDFGVAKARGRSQSTSGAGLRGKIRYMAPEQAFGRAVDRRTDVYALGIVLWEMLTCRRLFDAENDFALLDRVRAPEHVPPSRYAPGISPGLDAVVMSALASRPEDRPESALEFRYRLAELLPNAFVLGPPQLSALVRVALAHESAGVKAAPRAIAHDASTAAEGGVARGRNDATVTQTDAQTAPDDDSSTRGETLVAEADGAPMAPADLALVATLTVPQQGLRGFDEEAASMTPEAASVSIPSSAAPTRTRTVRVASVSLGAIALVAVTALGWQRFGSSHAQVAGQPPIAITGDRPIPSSGPQPPPASPDPAPPIAPPSAPQTVDHPVADPPIANAPEPPHVSRPGPRRPPRTHPPPLTNTRPPQPPAIRAPGPFPTQL